MLYVCVAFVDMGLVSPHFPGRLIVHSALLLGLRKIPIRR